jgi:hypothetical protein
MIVLVTHAGTGERHVFTDVKAITDAPGPLGGPGVRIEFDSPESELFIPETHRIEVIG